MTIGYRCHGRENFPSATLSTMRPIQTGLGSSTGLQIRSPKFNRLNHETARNVKGKSVKLGRDQHREEDKNHILYYV
jgi:hypothetical protein